MELCITGLERYVPIIDSGLERGLSIGLLNLGFT